MGFGNPGFKETFTLTLREAMICVRTRNNAARLFPDRQSVRMWRSEQAFRFAQ